MSDERDITELTADPSDYGEAKNPNFKKRQKHNYTSELELKSLLIRIKNDRANILNTKNNKKINKYIAWHTAMNAKKYDAPAKRNIVKNNVKAKIIQLSENTSVDKQSYERFGEIILLMIKNILTKPQFSGYTYKDDFYSDAIYKILKYLHNFDHTLISERSGIEVNAFAYISQIIHNSVLFILNSKKKEAEMIKKQVDMEHLNHNLELAIYETLVDTAYTKNYDTENSITEIIVLKNVQTDLVNELKKLEHEIERVQKLEVHYPADYRISFDEYNILKHMLKGKISIVRSTK